MLRKGGGLGGLLQRTIAPHISQHYWRRCANFDAYTPEADARVKTRKNHLMAFSGAKSGV